MKKNKKALLKRPWRNQDLNKKALLKRPWRNQDLNKKAQHEMVGFVLIVIIVSIVGLIFLTLFLNKKEAPSDIQVSNLLQAVMYYTSNCSSTNNEPREVEDLINECNAHPNKKCLEETGVCEVLDSTLKKALDESLNPGELYKNKAYNLSVYFRAIGSDRTPIRSISSLKNGNFKNCSSIQGGSHTITVSSSSGGIINVDLLVCKGGSGEINRE